MKTEVETLADVAILRISGRVDSASGGELCDMLVALVRFGAEKLIVELDASVELSRSGVRALVIAASLMREARRPFRIAAEAPLAESLRSRSFRHLFVIDPDRASALSRLADAAPDIARASRPRSVERHPRPSLSSPAPVPARALRA